MKWFIVALLYLQPNVEPHVVLNSDYVYTSFEKCHKSMIEKQWELRDSLVEKFPELDSHTKHYTMRCVSEAGAIEILNTLKNKGKML